MSHDERDHRIVQIDSVSLSFFFYFSCPFLGFPSPFFFFFFVLFSFFVFFTSIDHSSTHSIEIPFTKVSYSSYSSFIAQQKSRWFLPILFYDICYPSTYGHLNIFLLLFKKNINQSIRWLLLENNLVGMAITGATSEPMGPPCSISFCLTQ